MGGHGYFVMSTERITYGAGAGIGCCNWRWIVLSLGVLSFVSFFITIIVLGVSYPSEGPTSELTLGLSETRIVTIRSHWFDKYEGGEVTLVDRTPNINAINSTADFVQLMKFKKRPPLSAIDTWESNITAAIEKTDYYYWSWYFYAGSALDLRWNFTKPNVGFGPFLYLIKSEKGYDAFMEWVDVQENSLITPYLIDIAGPLFANYSLRVEEDDFYFAFFWNPSASTVNGYFNFNISSVIFDISNPDSSCFLPCSQSIPFSNDNVLIVVTPRTSQFVAAGNWSINTDFIFTPVNHSRLWFVILFFLAIGVGLLSSLCLILVMSYSIDSRKRNLKSSQFNLEMNGETSK